MLLKLQNTILELIAKGADLKHSVDTLCRSVEELMPDVVCSVLSLEADGRLYHLSSPGLPASYADAINGTPAGEGVGSCGTAAARGEQVIVTDIATHPYWRDFKHLALDIGLKACWSSPICSQDQVLGTFAFYFRTARGPSEMEQRLVAACVHICALAIEREQRLKERRRFAQTDPLTQMLNRGAFTEALAEAEASGESWGLLLADADNLKLVNDRLGHKAGDDLIIDIGKRLSALPPQCRSFRLGGDEFAVIIANVEEQDLGVIAQTLLRDMKTAGEVGGQKLFPSITIGGAVGHPGRPAEETQQNADHALYHAKERARGTFMPYRPGFGSTITRRYQAIEQVSDALREARVEAHYQPLIEIDSGRIIGLEALCRIRTTTGEIVAAQHFHEAIRDGDRAHAITERMLAHVARDVGDWNRRGLFTGRVGINVGAADLYRDNLLARVGEAFSGTGIALSRIVIEVTESVYLDQRDQTVPQRLAELREAGVVVALDDFGTGFASLTHLLTVPVDMLKIDRSFVQSLLKDNPGSVIIKGIIDIAHGLGIGVVAEGVETIEQQTLLRALGCERAQGFLYARALSPAAMETLLQGQWVEPTEIAISASA
ncbi:GGDEF domain-containing protein [Rhizobium halophytocola]|uniref:Diguanylate cyclase (GGDEF)-like protein n=1 Tax=Rhizobium halophytocola TaxID=735519 RepID=A0ABS4DX11_9HYPH|nr:GGDEF domain-containing protein [Rhizobium halophytocola]MBP1850228.1 diguanylate cyclase (GGDEF)-like protein [Rhizobium halophytocola]